MKKSFITSGPESLNGLIFMNDKSEKPESKTSTLHCLKIENPGLNCSLETNPMSVKKHIIKQ